MGFKNTKEQKEKLTKLYKADGKEDRIMFRPFDGFHDWFG
jgi:hypothetical protein